jgi:predicted oxidoreductase
MQKIKLHPQGPELSRIVAGAWRWNTVSPSQIDALIKTSLENGITSFDHADIYGNYTCEETFGNALRGNSSLRSQLKLITKFGIRMLSDKRPEHKVKHYDTSTEHIVKSVENSLHALGTDHIDILLIHRPDPLLNPEETAAAFAKLKQQGKVLFFGVSNFTTTQVEMLQSYMSLPLVTNQIELSLFKSDSFFNGDVDVMTKLKMRPMAWSPLGGGKFMDDERIRGVFEKMCGQYQVTSTQLLLAWLLLHPAGVVPIIGTTKTDRIAESTKALAVKLTRQDWFGLLKAVSGTDVA